MPSISVHEGDSYDPNGPLADLDRKVTVTTDEANEDMTDEERAATRRGVDPDALRDARDDHENGDGPQHVDLREWETEDGHEGGGTETVTPKKEEVPSSPGKTSSGSSTMPEPTTSETKPGGSTPLSAPTTAGPSTRGTASSAAAPSVKGK